MTNHNQQLPVRNLQRVLMIKSVIKLMAMSLFRRHFNQLERSVRNYLEIGGIYGHALLNQSQKPKEKSTVIYELNPAGEKGIENNNPLNGKR